MFSVIFEVHPQEGKKDDYLGHAKELKPILETMEGFIDNERFESRVRPGWVLSHSTWRDEKSLIRWRTQARHHLVQEKGRFEVFSDYHIRIGEIVADDAPPHGQNLREQRFDTTETGASKSCNFVELTPADGQSIAKAPSDLLHAIGLDAKDAALVEWDVYDSIYNPGKVAVLASWREEEIAKRFAAKVPHGVASHRQRAIRIIRDYSMFDRHETPQYYPDVRRHAA